MYISDDRSKRRVVIYVYKLEKNQDLKKKMQKPTHLQFYYVFNYKIVNHK